MLHRLLNYNDKENLVEEITIFFSVSDLESQFNNLIKLNFFSNFITYNLLNSIIIKHKVLIFEQ